MNQSFSLSPSSLLAASTINIISSYRHCLRVLFLRPPALLTKSCAVSLFFFFVARCPLVPIARHASARHASAASSSSSSRAIPTRHLLPAMRFLRRFLRRYRPRHSHRPHRRPARRSRRNHTPISLQLLSALVYVLLAAIVLHTVARYSSPARWRAPTAARPASPRAHPPPPPSPPPPLPAMRPPQFDSHLSTNHHNSSTSPPPPPFSHTCFHSSRTGDALCVHTPFCMRHDSLVYLSDNLRCAPFTDPHGLTRTLSMSRCVELQRDVEQRAHIENVQYKSSNWLTSLHQKHTALWFEGHTAFVRMTQSCLSVTHFAHRMFMLHHVLQHPHRYQLSPVANVVIAAHPDVARKIRFSKSWHHGLLAAVVHPNPIVYSFSAIRTAVTRPPSDPASLRVFVAPGLWHMAKGRHVPCFRRAALLPAVRTRMFLTRDAYPGVVVVDSPARNRSAAAAAPPPPPPPPSRYHDAHAFRALLFRSLRYGARPPRMQRRLLYLHRSRTRTLSAPGAALLERTLRGVARQFGLRYERVDHSGKTFAQQVHAVGTAAILVGVHGTQLLSSLFVARTAALVEIMPFQYGSELFEGGSGGGLFYARHSVLHGDHFPQLQQYASLDECRRNSRACREWYKSDERTVQFGEADAASVRTLSEQAGAYVIRKLEVEDRDEGQEQEQER